MNNVSVMKEGIYKTNVDDLESFLNGEIGSIEGNGVRYCENPKCRKSLDSNYNLKICPECRKENIAYFFKMKEEERQPSIVDHPWPDTGASGHNIIKMKTGTKETANKNH